MAVKTFRETASLTSNANFLNLQDGGSVPSTALMSPNTGWVTCVAFSDRGQLGEASELDSQTVRPVGSFAPITTSPDVPNNVSGNGFRVPEPLSGTFAAGNWTLGLIIRAITNSFTGQSRYRWRIFKAPSPEGLDYVELTGGYNVAGVVLSPTDTENLHTGTFHTVTATWSAPSIELQHEYLFFTISCEIIEAEPVGSDADVGMCVGSGATITTTDFSLLQYTESIGFAII